MTAAEHEAAIGQLLAELGDTADKVADTLRAKDIKGEKRPRFCPIANYVRESLPGLATVAAVPNRVKFWVTESAISAAEWVPTTPAVRAFMGNFDRGVYLDLVEVP